MPESFLKKQMQHASGKGEAYENEKKVWDACGFTGRCNGGRKFWKHGFGKKNGDRAGIGGNGCPVYTGTG